MANRSQQSGTKSPKKTLSELRMKAKPALTIIGVLLVGNIIWFVAWLIALGGAEETATNNEAVATIGKEDITRQEWLTAMEQRYGKEVLQTLVNEKVMLQAAEEFGIETTDEEVDLELALMRSVKDATDETMQALSEKELRAYVRTQLILEKVLTYDVVIEEAAAQTYYEENESVYNVPAAYRTSIIVSETADDAEAVVKELSNGSEFGVLARERSIDRVSATLDGDLGYITENVENQDPAILEAAQHVNEGEISEVFALQDGTYAVIQVDEVQEGRSFEFEQVKQQIMRILALEQLPMSVYPETFWEEFDATWFYGE
ncbi:peptidyl-prolyl cis-trans isomerase [Caryophanon tenue]|uniref:peptidylprolyl isomerase n=1 Tax=Caryophanon tenue TaxID=33978 RepID=A0A1C0YCF3_9BACL|nr:peptidyl-prolyl cis-trans isomerase [Caryophanon tenue]OCS84809.1 foldase [Caryophanon tenue]